MRVWKNLAGYDGRAALSTWIYAITRNRCLTALERRRRDLSLSDAGVAAQAESRAAPAAGGGDPQSALRELVEELPENYRRCLLLYYFEEQSVEQVAAMLAIPEGTVKTHLHRARALLAQRLKALGLDDARLWLEAGHERSARRPLRADRSRTGSTGRCGARCRHRSLPAGFRARLPAAVSVPGDRRRLRRGGRWRPSTSGRSPICAAATCACNGAPWAHCWAWLSSAASG